MGLLDLLIIAVGLSMDAFAVSVCKGVSVSRLKNRHLLTAGAYFGGFQMLMPLLGYFLGIGFKSLIESIDHWIAFLLLSLIGANMIKESRDKKKEQDGSFSYKAMLPLAVATSIDALVVGITFAVVGVNIFYAVIFIGIVTFALSAAGVKIGNVFGAKYRTRAEFLGGTMLILIGLKILLEHLGVINF